jgi:hypothetical protein
VDEKRKGALVPECAFLAESSATHAESLLQSNYEAIVELKAKRI